MTKEETIDLFQKGQDEWNSWASGLLNNKIGSPQWDTQAIADFSGHEFTNANFDNLIFPGKSFFYETKFKGICSFNGAEFHDYVRFDRATFLTDVSFDSSHFLDRAYFEGTKFKSASFIDTTFDAMAGFTESKFSATATFEKTIFGDRAWFWNANFYSEAHFWEARFAGFTNFGRAQFEGCASFTGIKVESSFRLDNSKFSQAPDFSQAHFTEAPRLDEIEIVELSNYKIRISLQTLKFQFKGNREKAAKFRALRRLAVQGFDQSQAEEFHRAELISERGVVDKYWSVSFILSLLYELFSDFGRSFWMPLTWWMAFAGAFTLLYVEFADTSCNCSRVSIYKAAMGLSLHQNLGPISNFDDKLPIWYERLYGSNVAPSKVLSLGIVQTMISASLIFFFLLAVRRRFRLKQ